MLFPRFLACCLFIAAARASPRGKNEAHHALTAEDTHPMPEINKHVAAAATKSTHAEEVVQEDGLKRLITCHVCQGAHPNGNPVCGNSYASFSECDETSPSFSYQTSESNIRNSWKKFTALDGKEYTSDCKGRAESMGIAFNGSMCIHYTISYPPSTPPPLSPGASISPPASPAPPLGQGDKATGCFPAHARVRVVGGETKRLDEISIGDAVHVGGDTFSEILLFAPRDTTTRATFIALHTAAAVITLTPGHYVHVDPSIDGVGHFELRPARLVATGHRLRLADGSSAAVSAVERLTATGLVSPVTKHGDIAVDGVVASCYTEAVRPALAHTLLAPLRALHDYLGLTVGSAFESGQHSRLWRALPTVLTDVLHA